MTTTSTATMATTAPVTAEGILAEIERLRALRAKSALASAAAVATVREIWGIEADGATALAMVELRAAYVAAGGKL